MLFVALVGLAFQILPVGPSDALTWKEQGLKLAGARKLEAAHAAFAKACEMAPKDPDACYYLARTLFSLGLYEEAREPFERALRAAPQEMLVKVHRAAALNFIALIRPADAERHFREAVRLSRRQEPANDDPRIDYGAFLFRQGRADEALPLLQQAVQAAAASARAHAELGRVLLHVGKLEAAAANLERAVQLDPGSSTSRLLLGRAYLELGRTAQAETQLRLGEQAWRQHQEPVKK